MKKLMSAVVSLLLLAAPSSALAWGAEGHQIVAAIAQQHLTPEARDGIQRLLGTAHIYDRDISSWADDIRSSQPATRGWHFVDIPISADTYSSSRDCEGGDCAVDKIEEFSRQIADSAVSRDDRITALKSLLHFMGDLHQPLHCSDDHDRGGNEVPVRYPGQPRRVNLHSVWDSAEPFHLHLIAAPVAAFANVQRLVKIADEVHDESQRKLLVGKARVRVAQGCRVAL